MKLTLSKTHDFKDFSPDAKQKRLKTLGFKPPCAEREGFEPSVDLASYDGLANRWFQPLTHLSEWLWETFARNRLQLY